MNRSGAAGAIHLEQVQTRYHPDEPPVLSGFNLQVQDGEVVCLLGPSGVGKTTALRVIAGFERVINGYVRLGGRLVGSPFLHIPPHQRDLGLVFQSYALFPHLSVSQNVQFGIKKSSDSYKRRRTSEILEMCGIGEYADRGVHELSGGEQQRVALARAIAPDSVAVLLDEPFSNLDPSLVFATSQAGQRHHQTGGQNRHFGNARPRDRVPHSGPSCGYALRPHSADWNP